jgi:hypothetical protein
MAVHALPAACADCGQGACVWAWPYSAWCCLPCWVQRNAHRFPAALSSRDTTLVHPLPEESAHVQQV